VIRTGNGGGEKYLGSGILMPDPVGMSKDPVRDACPRQQEMRMSAGGGKRYLGSGILMADQGGMC